LKLSAGLRESDRLPEPIFTPSTKAETGHDINVAQEYIENAFGKELTDKLKDKSLALYKKASEYALERGIIIADTKFEFGWHENELILIDEVLTPDSSRFWPKDEYSPGEGQPSFDKQYVRDYLKTVDWDKTYPGPELPQEIISKTTEKYLQALRMLTGKGL
jgi:phosphoribosylaminoimidazole-succinocarboxamide synthase